MVTVRVLTYAMRSAIRIRGLGAKFLGHLAGGQETPGSRDQDDCEGHADGPAEPLQSGEPSDPTTDKVGEKERDPRTEPRSAAVPGRAACIRAGTIFGRLFFGIRFHAGAINGVWKLS